MSKVIGFNIVDINNGAILATFPLTFPIHETVSCFEVSGNKVNWTWASDTAINYEQFDGYGMCEGCEKFDCINKYNECERCCDDVQVTA